jgi:hypothetical protein
MVKTRSISNFIAKIEWKGDLKEMQRDYPEKKEADNAPPYRFIDLDSVIR